MFVSKKKYDALDSAYAHLIESYTELEMERDALLEEKMRKKAERNLYMKQHRDKKKQEKK